MASPLQALFVSFNALTTILSSTTDDNQHHHHHHRTSFCVLSTHEASTSIKVRSPNARNKLPRPHGRLVAGSTASEARLPQPFHHSPWHGVSGIRRCSLDLWHRQHLNHFIPSHHRCSWLTQSRRPGHDRRHQDEAAVTSTVSTTVKTSSSTVIVIIRGVKTSFNTGDARTTSSSPAAAAVNSSRARTRSSTLDVGTLANTKVSTTLPTLTTWPY